MKITVKIVGRKALKCAIEQIEKILKEVMGCKTNKSCRMGISEIESVIFYI